MLPHLQETPVRLRKNKQIIVSRPVQRCAVRGGGKIGEKSMGWTTYPPHCGPEPSPQCTHAVCRDGFPRTVDKAAVHPLWGGLYPRFDDLWNFYSVSRCLSPP